MSKLEEVNAFTDGARIDPLPFDKSEYVPTDNRAYKFAKAILDVIMIPESSLDFRITHGGQVTATTKQIAQTDERKISFCSDFPIMINGIIGLLTFEMSKHLMFNYGAYYLAKCLLENIGEAMSYDELRVISLQLHDLLRDSSTNTCSFDNTRPLGVVGGVEKRVDEVFNEVERIIDEGIESGSNSSFEGDRKMIQNVVDELIFSISAITRTITCIDELCFNAGEFNVCNDHSFLKLFELVLRASTIDTHDVSSLQNYIDHTISMKDGNLVSFVDGFNKHFQEMAQKTYNTLMNDQQLENDIAKVHLILKSSLFAELGTVAAVAIVRVCRMIANTRLSYLITDGRSTRIQFFQVFQALLQSTVSLDIDLDRYDLFVLYHSLTSSRQMKARVKKQKQLIDKQNDDDEHSSE